MKVRIQDNSIRFRVTLKEVEDFDRQGRLERRMRVPALPGQAAEFVYALEYSGHPQASEVILGERSITFRLGAADRSTLLDPAVEGIYVQREWTAPDGTVQRFLAFAEKDRPGSTCVKHEAWIYDAPPRGPVETRPIPKRHQTT